MEHKHTPGPWHLEGHIVYGPAHAESRHPNGRICIARVLRAGTERADPLLEGGADRFGFDSEADARLIAASPSMFAALEIIAAGNTDPDEMVKMARAAIAKATGEPQ